jgi:hypothetical protein
MPIERITERDVNNNGPVLNSQDEQMHLTLPKVVLHFNKEKEEGMGTLFITTRYVRFQIFELSLVSMLTDIYLVE